MSRSIHTTIKDIQSELPYRHRESKPGRFDALLAAVGKKRRIKASVRRQRRLHRREDQPLVTAEAVRITVFDEGRRIHYPAAPADIRALMSRLPPGALDGLSGINLRVAALEHESAVPPESRVDTTRDPWYHRASAQSLPGVYAGRYLGMCRYPPAEIDLFAYIYEVGLPPHLELYCRLEMLATFVHELAHHDDHMRRVARGRWRAEVDEKAERYAEATAAAWVRDYVVPYVQDTYSSAVRDLNDWLVRHGGIAIPLHLLAGNWRWPEKGRRVALHSSGAQSAFEHLVNAVYRGEGVVVKRLAFAGELHRGGLRNEACSVMNEILAELPRERGELAPMMLSRSVDRRDAR